MSGQRQYLDSTHAFCVLAHTDLAMFQRLTEQLLKIGPVYAHIDAKSDLRAWAKDSPEIIFLDNPAKVYWGHWSMVDATMKLMDQALLDPDVTRVTLLSGSHYLILSPADIAVRAVSSGDIIAARQAPNMEDGSRPEIEYRRRFVATKDPNSLEHKVVNAFVNRVVYAGRPLEWRNLTGPQGMRAGSAWWSLTRQTSTALLERIRENDPLIRYFKRVACVDEKVFATLFAELDPSPHPTGTTFAKWAGRANPESLTRDDLEAARREPFWFARKFSSTKDSALLDWLDETNQ
jgi:core-2/I-Branching enzyme